MPESGVVMLEDNATEAMSYWGFKPESWRVVGFVTSGLEGVSRPIMQVADARYVLRRQADDLTENDTLFRHTFMRHLASQGLPVPELLARPSGHTYAVTTGGIYELQAWQDGQPYVTDGPAADARLAAAATTLGRLHQASADFQWKPHLWPEERSAAAIAQAYCGLIGERAQADTLPERVRNGLARVAEAARQRLDLAVDALDGTPGPPRLHIHGDYQAHNLAFDAAGVSSIYDLDAARWDARLSELAYSLLYFTGVRWDEQPTVTPPLVEDGLDVPRVQRFLRAYGDEAPPAEGEARLLADALALHFPVVFANGVAEDLIFTEDYDGPPDETDALARLLWADSFWLWLDRNRDTLAEAWEGA